MKRASPEFLPSNAARPQIVVLNAFCGIENTKIDFGRSFNCPGPTGELHRSPIGLPYSWWGAEL